MIIQRLLSCGGISHSLIPRSHRFVTQTLALTLSRGSHGAASIHLNRTSEFLKKLFEAKETKELSFVKIANQIKRSEIWTASLFYGQAKPEQEDLAKLSVILEVPLQDLKKAFPNSYFPTRGMDMKIPPSDPLLYRFHEFLLVYGLPLKSIIHEKFGDGIMSAIDFTCEVEKVKEDQAERVLIKMNGKWLPYKRW